VTDEAGHVVVSRLVKIHAAHKEEEE
jgi:hypothetical protein